MNSVHLVTQETTESNRSKTESKLSPVHCAPKLAQLTSQHAQPARTGTPTRSRSAPRAHTCACRARCRLPAYTPRAPARLPPTRPPAPARQLAPARLPLYALPSAPACCRALRAVPCAPCPRPYACLRAQHAQPRARPACCHAQPSAQPHAQWAVAHPGSVQKIFLFFFFISFSH